MRYLSIALLGFTVSLAACSGGGGSGRNNAPAPASQGFVDFTRSTAATAPEDAEPIDVDQLALPTPEDAEPEAS